MKSKIIALLFLFCISTVSVSILAKDPPRKKLDGNDIIRILAHASDQRLRSVTLPGEIANQMDLYVHEVVEDVVLDAEMIMANEQQVEAYSIEVFTFGTQYYYFIEVEESSSDMVDLSGL